MMIEPIGPTKPAAGVTATSPATAPEAAPSIEGLPLAIDSPIRHQATTAAAVARKVLMKARPATRSASSAEPALKPNQPTHSSEAPTMVSVRRVRRHRFTAVADALADHVSTDETGDAGIDVDHGTAGEVERALLPEPAGVGRDRGQRFSAGDRIRPVAVPHHVSDGEVAEGEPEHAEQQHRRELDALGERADDQRAGDRRERPLEGNEDISGMTTPLLKVAATDSDGDAPQEQLVETTEEGAAAEGQRCSHRSTTAR